jgi:LL-diaminopimelate aminotransferase
MNIEISQNLNNLPPYLFEEIDKAKKKAIDEGRDVIDLGVGDPDTATPDIIVEALKRASEDPANQKYPMNKGLPELRRAMALWYQQRFNVELDPDTEILPLLGSKEGIAHIPLAFINSGDAVLVPEPGYPVYTSGTILAGGEVCHMPLKSENGFLPDLSAIDTSCAKKARIMHINYPNNPTGAVCDVAFYEEIVDFARRNGIIVCSDAAYTEIAYDGYRPPSFLEARGAKDVGIEFHSLSKTFNMTGWRVGMAVGNSDVIRGLAKVKSNIDSGIFTAVQKAAVTALENVEEVKSEMAEIYTSRRDTLVQGLREAGWDVPRPLATFYIWAPVFGGYDSFTLAKELLERTDIIATPGNGFGPSGEGYVRMALTKDSSVLEKAVKRISGEFFK